MGNELRDKKVNLDFKENIEPQEVLLDSLAQKKEIELGITGKKFETPLSKKIAWFFYGLFLLVLVLFLAQTIKFQIFEGEKFSLLAKENKTYTYPIRSTRGVIYDQEGNQLVFNESSFDLVFDKKETAIGPAEKARAFASLAKIISLDAKEIEKKISKAKEPRALILENIPQESLLLLETKINSRELPGFWIEKNSVRNYQDGPHFSHLIGYMGRINAQEYQSLSGYFATDYLGKSGIEKYYEEVLRGTAGVVRVEKNALGEKKLETVEKEPQAGESLVLWLDSELQKKLEEELTAMLKKIGSTKGVAIAMNPKTGGVLALISLPSFDNNLFSGVGKEKAISELFADEKQQQPFFNRAIAGTYPSGSTIKPLIASAVLEEKLISPTKQIEDPGFILVPNPWNPEKPTKYMDWMPHGLVDLRKAIAVSCNVYFYTVGGGYAGQEGLGPSRIKKYLELFGWGNKTRIDLPGEEKGMIPDPAWKESYFENAFEKVWRSGDTYNLSIGQGYLLVTPIQVVTAFSAIANGGRLLEPRVVKGVIDTASNPDFNFQENGQKAIKELPPQIIREDFIDAKNLQIVREGMRDAVRYGSSVILNSLSVKLAAKTGTAETSKPGYYHNWVTVFGPYEDPEIVLTVVIENVKEAQVAALPVAKNVLEWYFNR